MKQMQSPGPVPGAYFILGGAIMSNEQLVIRIRAGEDTAANMLQLWKQNQRFIGMIAVKYSGYAEMDDLKQEGYLALCEAVRHYNPDQGVPFINYAAFYIRQGMQRYIENSGNCIRIPVHRQQSARKYKKIVAEYQKDMVQVRQTLKSAR